MEEAQQSTIIGFTPRIMIATCSCVQVGFNPLHAGMRPILRWTVRMRLDTSGLPNPVNRYAKCQVSAQPTHCARLTEPWPCPAYPMVNLLSHEC